MGNNDEELLNPDDLSDTITEKGDGGNPAPLAEESGARVEERGETPEDASHGGGDPPEEKGKDRGRLRALLVGMSLFLVLAALVSSGIVVYQARVSDSFSSAIENLFAARTGAGSGQSYGPGEDRQWQHHEYRDFVIHIAGNGGEDRILLYDATLEFPETYSLDEAGRQQLRIVMYRVSKEAVSEMNIRTTPLRLVRREIERRILEATAGDSVRAVYFTRFVVI